MTVGKVHVELISEDVHLGVISTQGGDHYELKGLTTNHIRRRVEDFCKLNQIVLAKFPSYWAKQRCFNQGGAI